jgi:peptidoglycan/xylan/chitin deacetylase (PgdA/CDA1 family)
MRHRHLAATLLTTKAIGGALVTTFQYAAPTITPSIVSELLSNPDFETFTGGQADSWSKSGTPTLTQEATIIQSLLSSQKMVGDGGGVYQTKTATRYKWYRYSGYLYVSAGSARFYNAGSVLVSSPLTYSTAAWLKIEVSCLQMSVTNSDGPFAQLLSAGTTAYVDNASFAELSFTSLRTKLGTRTGSYKITCHPVTVTNSQAGVIVKYLDDNNFVMAIVNTGTRQIELYKRVAGTYTLVANSVAGSVVPEDGGELRLVINGTSYQMFYNGAAISTPQTISDSLGDDIYGFATNASNSVGAVQTFALGTAYGGTPTIIFTFDDGILTQYTQAYPYLASKGVHGTAFILYGHIGGSYMSWAQMQEMDAAGWDIGGHNEVAFTSSTSVADATTEINTIIAALESHNLTKASHHLAYSGGARYANTDTAMRNLGMKTGRVTNAQFGTGGTDLYNYNALTLPCVAGLSSALSLAAAKAFVDTCVAQGRIGIFYGHSLGPKDGTTWEIADFQALVDYVIASGAQIKSITEVFG